VSAPARVRSIPLSAPDLSGREEELVLEAMRSGILGLGPMADRFEQAFAGFCGTRHAAAVSSGTAGLHLAVRLHGIGPGDEVVTTPISFVASANAVLFERGTPVFVDVDNRTFNLDPAAVEAAVTPRTKAILAVHIFGYPAPIEALNDIASRHGLAVIEDAAEAVGTRRRGARIGTHGNLAVFAFYPNKQMTTGEGGMVTTDDPRLYAELKSLSNQGRSDTGDWLEHDRLGFNYRMDELSAAVGVGQMERLSGIDGVTIPAPGLDGDERSWFVYVIRLDDAVDRNAAMAALQARGVACKPYLPAVHLQPFYRSLGHGEGECPVAERIAASTLALPFHTRLPAADQEYVAGALRDVMSSA
jgi:perosamine synthetase